MTTTTEEVIKCKYNLSFVCQFRKQCIGPDILISEQRGISTFCSSSLGILKSCRVLDSIHLKTSRKSAQKSSRKSNLKKRYVYQVLISSAFLIFNFNLLTEN